MNAKQVAELTGVSVRTLHHYDQIGLLCPGREAGNGYRSYTQGDLDTLQQILFFRACGFPLSKIRELIQSPSFDRRAAFQLQRKALLHEKQRIERMLQTLDATIQNMEGDTQMETKDKFAGLDFSHNPYEEEARQLWGDDAVNQSNAHMQGLGKKGQQELKKSFDAMFQSLATLVGQDPAGEEAQKAMAKLYAYFNSGFGTQYTPEMFAGLGRMYVEDERFTKNIDKYGKGLSAFLAEAMGEYAKTIG